MDSCRAPRPGTLVAIGMGVAAMLALSVPVRAAGGELAGPQGPQVTLTTGHSNDHGSHPNHVSILLGAARNGAIDETAFTIGAGYRYALNDRISIGPSVDFAFYAHENTTLLLAALYWKAEGSLVLMTGAGVEFVSHESASHGASHESRPALRAGAGWELHAGRASVMPFVAADFIDGHTTMVYAVDIGLGF